MHGALLDANLLAEVYLAMTGGKRPYSSKKKGGLKYSKFRESQYFKNDFIEAAVSNTDIETDANYFSDHSSSQ